MLDTLIHKAHDALPEWVASRFKGDWNIHGFKKYISNTGWALIARIITFATSFFTVAIVARYLGPENLGKIEYAQSFIAIISVIASLGIDQILYRDLVTHPEKEKDLLGTAIFSKLIFGFIAFILSIGISYYIGNATIYTLLIAISAFTFIINPIGTVNIFFNAEVKSKYNSHISIFLAFFIPALKLLIIYFNRGVIFFAFIFIIESLVTAIWCLYIYIVYFHKNPFDWRFHFETFNQLMKDSWPLLLAGFSGYVYAKMDQVLILHYIDDASVGIYGAAVKLTQIWAFLPGLIITSLFPAIVNGKKAGFESYSNRFKALCGISIGATIAIALPLFIFAPLVVNIVFGDSFSGASSILRIYLWTSVVITMVVLAQHYLIAENLSRIFLYTSLIGAISNIILNVILIPRYGTHGSAWGTMLSYLIVVLSLLLFKKSRTGLYNIIVSK